MACADCTEYLTVDNYHFINEKYYCQRHYNSLKPKFPMANRMSGNHQAINLEKRENEDIHGTDEDQSHSIENKEEDNQSSDLVEMQHRNQSKDSEDKTDDPSKSNIITKEEILEQTDSNSNEEDVNDEFQQLNNKSVDNSPSLSPYSEENMNPGENNQQNENDNEKENEINQIKENLLKLSIETPSTSSASSPTASPSQSPTFSSSHSDNLERFTIQLNRSSSSALNKVNIIEMGDDILLSPPASFTSANILSTSISISPSQSPKHSQILENKKELTKEDEIPVPVIQTENEKSNLNESLETKSISTGTETPVVAVITTDNKIGGTANNDLSEILQDDLNIPQHPNPTPEPNASNENHASSTLTDPSKTESSNTEGFFF